MVLAEIAIVAALVVVSWHVLAGGAATTAPQVIPAVFVPQDPGPAPQVPGVLSPPSPTAPLLLPGLNLDAGFWRLRLVALNAAEAQVEALEWRFVHSALVTIQRYLLSVVVADVRRAESGGG
jgi:hypothetical protein